MGKISACHDCKWNGAGSPRCIKCKRVNQDDIRIRKTPHARSEMIGANPTPQDPPTTCTPLSEENEQKLRIAMATLFGLDPIQLLLVQHIMRGGRLSEFGDTLRKTHEQIRRYRGSERAQAGMMRNAVFSRAPILAPVLTPLIKGEDTYSPMQKAASHTPRTSTPHNAGVCKATAHESASMEDAVSAIGERMRDEPLGDLFEFSGVSAPFDELKRKTRR